MPESDAAALKVQCTAMHANASGAAHLLMKRAGQQAALRLLRHVAQQLQAARGIVAATAREVQSLVCSEAELSRNSMQIHWQHQQCATLDISVGNRARARVRMARLAGMGGGLSGLGWPVPERLSTPRPWPPPAARDRHNVRGGSAAQHAAAPRAQIYQRSCFVQHPLLRLHCGRREEQAQRFPLRNGRVSQEAGRRGTAEAAAQDAAAAWSPTAAAAAAAETRRASICCGMQLPATLMAGGGAGGRPGSSPQGQLRGGGSGGGGRVAAAGDARPYTLRPSDSQHASTHGRR